MVLPLFRKSLAGEVKNERSRQLLTTYGPLQKIEQTIAVAPLRGVSLVKTSPAEGLVESYGTLLHVLLSAGVLIMQRARPLYTWLVIGSYIWSSAVGLDSGATVSVSISRINVLTRIFGAGAHITR